MILHELMKAVSWMQDSFSLEIRLSSLCRWMKNAALHHNKKKFEKTDSAEPQECPKTQIFRSSHPT
jgi:hypothetical protein